MAEASAVPSLRPPRSRAGFLLVVAVVAVALGVAITFISVGQEGEPVEITGVGQTNELLGGIAQEGAALGSPEAPVTISIFNDLQCPDCADYHLRIVPPLVRDLVRGGDARLELRHFSIGRQAPTTLAAIAATAAGEQARQWQFVHIFFLNIEQAGVRVDEEYLRAVAGSAGLDVSEWAQERESPEVAAAVEADAALARDLELPAAPAAVVDGPGGTRQLTEEPSVEQIEAAVESVR